MPPIWKCCADKPRGRKNLFARTLRLAAYAGRRRALDGAVTMKLLYFTTASNEESYEKLQARSRKKASVAPQVFETALLRAMAQRDDLELTLRSFPMIAAFPKSPLLLWGARRESVADKLTTEWLPTVNLYGLKQWSQRLSSGRAVKRWLRKNKNEPNKAVLLYSVYEPIAASVQKYCKKYGCKSFVIVPDLPRDMYKELSPNKAVALFQKRYMRRAVACQDGFDAYIYLTEAMREVVAPCAPYTVMEGIADLSAFGNETKKETAKKAIMYAGNLSMQCGVGNLIEAFCMLDRKDTELWLFGEGSGAAQAEAFASENERIRFFGRRSRQEVLAYEQRAELLINVRDPNDLYTRYSFPSKTIEYMLSGTAVLTTRLSGIPKEYEKHLLMMDDNAPETIAHAMQAALAMPTDARHRMGKEAADFIASQKNGRIQADKIIRFISRQL